MNRTDLLSLPDVVVKPVEVPEWRTTLHVRSLSCRERAALLPTIRGAETSGKDPSVLVAMACTCDEAGKLMFAPEDEDALSAKSASALDRLARAALEVLGLDLDAAKND